jgi:hypothetical protein
MSDQNRVLMRTSVWEPTDKCGSCNHTAKEHGRPETPFGSMPCAHKGCKCGDWHGS